jgi:hypothetical protein
VIGDQHPAPTVGWLAPGSRANPFRSKIPSGYDPPVVPNDPLPAIVSSRIASLPEVLSVRPEVVFAYLFGSAARDELYPLSDVDVAVFLADGVDALDARADLLAIVTGHLATDRVDLIVLNDAPTALLGRVLLDRRVLCDKDPFRRHRFESRALREFHDFRLFEHRLLERRRRG